MTKARDLADIVSNLSANAEKAVVVNAGGTELTFGDAGSSDLYGFVKTNGTGTQKEDLIDHKTNGTDGQPNNNPMPAINFASPSPIPSTFLNVR